MSVAKVVSNLFGRAKISNAYVIAYLLMKNPIEVGECRFSEGKIVHYRHKEVGFSDINHFMYKRILDDERTLLLTYVTQSRKYSGDLSIIVSPSSENPVEVNATDYKLKGVREFSSSLTGSRHIYFLDRDSHRVAYLEKNPFGNKAMVKDITSNERERVKKSYKDLNEQIIDILEGKRNLISVLSI